MQGFERVMSGVPASSDRNGETRDCRCSTRPSKSLTDRLHIGTLTQNTVFSLSDTAFNLTEPRFPVAGVLGKLWLA